MSNYHDIVSGKCNILFGTPESFICNKLWRNMLTSKFYVTNLVCLVVDEVHKVVWGESSSTSSTPFREAFSRINELRSLCKPCLPILALSATVNVDITDLIISSCNLSKSLNIISTCPDRPNICLCVFKIKKKDAQPLSWILDKLVENKSSAPKVIIFCRTVELCGFLYESFLQMNQMLPEEVRKYIAIYHSSSFSSVKSKIQKALYEETDIRVVIATSSLGCGIDMRNVSFIVHFGPAYDSLDYCQQIGRAGRDSNTDTSYAILYSYPRAGQVSKNMTSYIKASSNQCLRSKLFTPFNQTNETVQSVVPAHNCCSFCVELCKCSKCDPSYLKGMFLSKLSEGNTPNQIKIRDATDEEKEVIRELLIEHHSFSKSVCGITPPEIVSGITESVIDSILLHLPFIDSIDYILQNLPVVSKAVAKEILVIINEVFEDIDSSEDIQDEVFANISNDKFVFSDIELVFSDDNISDNE